MMTTFEPGDPVAGVTGALPRLEPLRYVRANALEVAYFEAGPGDGEAVLLLHGFPFDIHSYVDVIPRLAAAGHRVIVPYLRGHGPTRFTDSAAPRSGQQASIGTASDWHPAAPPHDQTEKSLAAQPPITVPAVTLDGLADGDFPATDGSTSARHFTGPRVHHQIPNAGHNLPQESPDAFASAVLELTGLRAQSGQVRCRDSASEDGLTRRR